MTELFFCRISVVNAAAGTVDVVIPDREDVVKSDVPILDTVHRLPEIGELAVVLFSVERGRIGRGVMIGCPYRPESVMEVSANVLKVKEIHAGDVLYTGRCERG